jgi:hypothetical protein
VSGGVLGTPRTLVSGDIPNNAASTSANAGTATALAANPTDCSSNQFADAIDAGGNLTCTAPFILTTTGSSGSATYSAGTLNIPQYAGGGGTGNAANEVAVTFSATPTFTCGSASAGTTTHFTVAALTGNITSSTLSTCTAGQAIGFHFVQDATGGHTVAMPTNWDALTVDGTASTATDAAYWYDGTNGRLTSVNGKATPFLLGQAPERAAPTTATSCGSGLGCFWFDSTNHIPSFKDNNSGTVSIAVAPDSGSANNFLTAISAAGVISKAQPAFSNLSGTPSATQLTNVIVPVGSSLSASTGSGLVLVGTSLTAGDVYYLGSSGLALAKADSASTIPGMCIAISTTQCAFSGVYRFSGTQSWTAGNLIYVSAAAAGALVTSAPATSTNLVQRIGVALANDTMLILPSLDAGTVQ